MATSKEQRSVFGRGTKNALNPNNKKGQAKRGVVLKKRGKKIKNISKSLREQFKAGAISQEQYKKKQRQASLITQRNNYQKKAVKTGSGGG